LSLDEPQFTAPRYIALDGTDRGGHPDQASILRRNKQAADERRHKILDRTNVT